MTSQLPLARVIKDPLAKPPNKGTAKHYSHNHLQSLLDGFVDFSGVENCKLTFKGLSLNSKKVHEDYLFLACSSVGNSLQHGVAYAGEAMNFGATCVVWEPTVEVENMPVSCPVKKEDIVIQVPMLRVEDLHDKAGEIAARFYQHPSRSLNVVGITGTNGKTSIAHFIAQLIYKMSDEVENITAAEKKCALIGTLGNGFYGELEQSIHTTPDAVTVQELIAKFRDEDAETLVMEVSSHALSQGRVNGVEFDCAVFSNLTRDHLDYHGDMKSYADEKLKLFHFASLQQVVLNQDDSFSETIANSIAMYSSENIILDKKISVLRCSKKDNNSEYFADAISLHSEGISFCLHVKGEGEFIVKTHLVGDFNIDNLLASVAVLHSQGYEINKIISAIEELHVVPGRMEKIIVPGIQNLPLIVVDYAHTPDALDKALCALKAHAKGKLICLFGCGGDRDKGKRSLMAKIAEQQADQIIVTSDNPRTESAQTIIKDIIAGFKSLDNVLVEIDRKKAIDSALKLMNSNDALLIAGKGHEEYQEINGQRFTFSDKDSVTNFIKLAGSNI